MSATDRRPGGPHEKDFDPRALEPDDVARPLVELAAQPREQVPAAPGPAGRAATQLRASRQTAQYLATLASMAWLSGCSPAESAEFPRVCLQAAAGQSFTAPAPGDVSTEGGGLDFIGRARDVAPVPGSSGTAGAGGAASNQERTGTGRASRDRSGLVDAWPEVRTPPSDLTARFGLSKG
jgi:hypothetical protein